MCEGFVYKRKDSITLDFDKEWLVLKDGMLRHFKTQEDAHDGRKALGSLTVADMRVDHDSGPVAGPDGPLECFAFTLADLEANRGHVRRILCGVISREDREMWTSALDSTQVKRTPSGRSVPAPDAGCNSRLPPREKWLRAGNMTKKIVSAQSKIQTRFTVMTQDTLFFTKHYDSNSKIYDEAPSPHDLCSDEQIWTVFKGHDLDNNGYIFCLFLSFFLLRLILPFLALHECTLQNSREHFVESTDNRVIDRSELKEVLTDLNLFTTEIDANTLFVKLDTDSSGFLDFDEFKQLCKQSEESMKIIDSIPLQEVETIEREDHHDLEVELKILTTSDGAVISFYHSFDME